jgi:hypothetical protein
VGDVLGELFSREYAMSIADIGQFVDVKLLVEFYDTNSPLEWRQAVK